MNSMLKRLVVGAATVGMAGAMLAPSFVAAGITEDELWGGNQGATANAVGGTVAGALGQSNQSITVTVAKIIRAAFGLLGIAAVVIIIIGGFEWMMAGGDEGKVKTAKTRILQGVIGMAIMLSAFAIAQFIVKSLTSATTG